MRPWHREFLISLLVGLTPAASAQDRQPDRVAPDGAAALPSAVLPSAALPSNAPASLTGKERLGRKWMDEQRIDNCNVPPDKRGTRPRRSTCPHVPTG